jgi:hypothetical protein
VTIRELAAQVLEAEQALPPATPEAILGLLANGRRLTGREIAFGLGMGRDARIEALVGGGVYAALSQLMQARMIGTDPATSRYFILPG